MAASQDTIDCLAESASRAMAVVYSTIKDDIAVLKLCDSHMPALLTYMVELRIDLNFIMVNLGASFHALISATRPVEKRFHIQNIWADILESYKLLYGFGKIRSHSIWARIGAEIQLFQVETMTDRYSSLRQSYEMITVKLSFIEPTDQDKTDRDLTYHYDDELLAVYDRILRADDEDLVSKRLIDVMDVFQQMLQFCEFIEQLELDNGHCLPKSPVHDNMHLSSQKVFAEYMREHSDLQRVLETIIDDADSLDKAARVRYGVMRIKDFAEKKAPDFELPEADNMDRLSNANLLLQYMLLEGAAITNAYLRSGCEPAFPLMLRRLTLTRVSTLVHLYGYDDREQKRALWTGIVSMIPSSAEELQREAAELSDLLRGLVVQQDKDDRVLCVHLLNNSTYISNVPAIVEQIEVMNPVLELQKMDNLLKANSRLQKFLKSLMDRLAGEAHEHAASSTAEMLTKIQRFRDFVQKANCPAELKEKIYSQMDEIEQLMKDPLSARNEKMS